MSVASKLTSIAENLQAKLDAINVKLTAKGQTEAANLNEVPDKIEAIETKKQDVLNLVSGITKYTDSFEINGELRSNVLVQPSDFSDESTITWNSKADSYFSHSIENIEGSENGSVMVLNPVRTTETSVYNLFWFNSTVNASTSESRTYLIAVRAKASETITSYFPNMAITYYPTGSTGSKFLYFSYAPTTEWQTFYVIANIPENYYLKDITMCFCSRGITHYIDWIVAYDITGTDFDYMTFGANATATASDVLSDKTFYKDGVRYTGTMATKSAAIYTPSTIDQSILAGYYLSGNQTIQGDSNLVSSNIKNGVSIFGVRGNYTGDNSLAVSAIRSAYTSSILRLPDARNYNYITIILNDLSKFSSSNAILVALIYNVSTKEFVQNLWYMMETTIVTNTNGFYNQDNISEIITVTNYDTNGLSFTINSNWADTYKYAASYRYLYMNI